MNMGSDENSFIDRIKFKVTMWMMNRNANNYTTKEKNTTHNYGFSYVAVFKIVNLLIAILVFLMPFVLGSALFRYNTPDVSLLVIGQLVVAFIVYWILTLPIKLFENIAIIAQNSTEIRNKLNK